MAKKLYESDTTEFLKKFLRENPEIRDKQREARSKWWDLIQDEDSKRELDETKVPKKPYEYY